MSLGRPRLFILIGPVLLMLGHPTVGSGGIGPGSKIPAIYISAFDGLNQDDTLYIETPQGTPLVGATVKLVFPPEACDLLVLCNSSYSNCPRTFQATTDGAGKARFKIFGGGCWGEGKILQDGITWGNETLPESYLVQVFVNTELVALRGVRSPDVVDAGVPSPKLATQLWKESPPSTCQTPYGQSATTLTDVVFLSNPFKSAGDPWVGCADLNGDGRIDLTDLVVATPPLRAGSNCSESAN